MKKYVYLFELDSVRKTDKEIIKGQDALYNEIVKNGNIVVLTYNQLVDSRAFFSLLDDKEYYENFIELFKKGYIRVSQYGTTRTISQYLLDSIDTEDNEFFYSALPIKISQRRLVELIKRSLTYSDLSEINEYIHRINRTDDDLIDLFVEVEISQTKGIKKQIEKRTDLSIGEMDNILENLYWLLGMTLNLSTIHDIFVSPREPAEYANFRLMNYLKYVSSVHISSDMNPLWNKAIEILRNLKCWGSNNRSLYFRELRYLFLKKKKYGKDVYQYAEAIVSICTNYAYEISICNISKHYNASDFECEASENSSFFRDFLYRLNLYWDSGNDAENKFLQSESNDFREFENMSEIPDFSKAVRIVSEIEDEKSNEDIHRYEYKLKSQRRMIKFSFLKKVIRQVTSLLFVAILVMLLNVLLGIVQNLYSGENTSLISWNKFFSFCLETIVFFVLGEFITTRISKRFPRFMSLSEAVKSIICVLGDAGHLLFSKTNTYVSEYEIEKTEKRSNVAPIDFCKSLELKKYESLYTQNPKLFTDASEYPIANVKDRSELKRIVRNQEIYRRKYGVVYSSPFNTMIVDPIADGNNDFYSYERIVPSVMKSGVVLFTLCNDKIVLIRQFRHAIRKEQLCCPRGFGEKGISTSENAKKELLEELDAKAIEEPIELGTITADSGLSGGNATAYLVKIDKYNKNKKEEGIREIIEVSSDEFREKVRNGEIDDGYTLAAYSLYSEYIS